MRKIKLPIGFDPKSGYSIGGNVACDHDYPLESETRCESYIQFVCTRCGMQRRYKPFVRNDVFESGFTLPGKVCIVGSGPNGNGHHSSIVDNCYIIAVNQAVTIEGILPDVWMCMDVTCPKKDWWNDAYLRFGKPELRERPITIFGEMVAEQWPADYTFKNGQAMNYNDFLPVAGFLRPGATISCQALQLCYLLGVEVVYLFGIDMYGNKYFDGGESKVHHDDEPWNCVNRFSSLIKFLRGEGMTIEALTETYLEV